MLFNRCDIWGFVFFGIACSCQFFSNSQYKESFNICNLFHPKGFDLGIPACVWNFYMRVHYEVHECISSFLLVKIFRGKPLPPDCWRVPRVPAVEPHESRRFHSRAIFSATWQAEHKLAHLSREQPKQINVII